MTFSITPPGGNVTHRNTSQTQRSPLDNPRRLFPKLEPRLEGFAALDTARRLKTMAEKQRSDARAEVRRLELELVRARARLSLSSRCEQEAVDFFESVERSMEVIEIVDEDEDSDDAPQVTQEDIAEFARERNDREQQHELQFAEEELDERQRAEEIEECHANELIDCLDHEEEQNDAERIHRHYFDIEQERRRSVLDWEVENEEPIELQLVEEEIEERHANELIDMIQDLSEGEWMARSSVDHYFDIEERRNSMLDREVENHGECDIEFIEEEIEARSREDEVDARAIEKLVADHDELEISIQRRIAAFGMCEQCGEPQLRILTLPLCGECALLHCARAGRAWRMSQHGILSSSENGDASVESSQEGRFSSDISLDENVPPPAAGQRTEMHETSVPGGSRPSPTLGGRWKRPRAKNGKESGQKKREQGKRKKTRRKHEQP